MEIEKPIFIIGVGRSGSTIFHRLMSYHPRCAWLSTRLGNKFPHRPSINRRMMQFLDYPVVGPFLRGRIDPGECYSFWEHYCTGFSTPCRDLRQDDVTHRNKSRVRKALSQLISPKRPRLLLKITGWPRIGFLREIFPDARFIHIMRDGRAVANSMINIGFWWGWRGPANWRWGELSPEFQAEWEKHERSFLALAAIEWKILMDSFDKAGAGVSEEQLMTVKYEDLCEDALGMTRQVCDFCDLDWDSRLEARIRKSPMRNTNHKWQSELTDSQQAVLNDVLGEYLRRYAYAS
ncbi:MAG: sulfotransferase family protein [Candidatus Sumerlaeia bacterium]